MTELKHYREEDTRLYLSGLELKKIKKGDNLDPGLIAMAVKTVDGKYSMMITYNDLLNALLFEINEENKRRWQRCQQKR